MGPGAYKTQSKYTKSKSPYPTGMKGHEESKPFRSYWMQVRGKRDGVPVSWFWCNQRCVKLTNRPNSAGMGPGVYKTQSIHTKTKSPYPTGMNGHKESKHVPSYWIQVKGKKDRLPVSWFPNKISPCKFANWPNSAGMGPGVYKTQSNNTKNKSPYPTGMNGHKESKPSPSYWMQVKGMKGWLPVSWFFSKCRICKFANWPNSAGMGPGAYKTQSKHTKNKSAYPTGMNRHKESKPFRSYWMQVRGKEGWITGKLVVFQMHPR
jgi:hypothetical protein